MIILANKQNPEVLIVACSDSRVVPNLSAQTDPGELFVLRNAGNIVPPYGTGDHSSAATIEYAVEVLGVKHIVVCGHSNCGAMKALLNPAKVKHLTAISDWLEYAETPRRVVENECGEEKDSVHMEALIRENVRAQIQNLRTHPSVASALSKGKLEIHGCVYDIGAGTVQRTVAEKSELVEWVKV